ncbi:UDP-N-acetylmuramoyl-L-alanine--D-glutamate ligase [Nakamurella sp. UYEF19]|uniref:UDP-N-acetylmuramoyl-L-alanine--D-glutamate ligase n=1 Tax=Nakamurella sp. UYEF19 TaxID=1756392 RepID=UPI0033997770
MLPRAGDLVVVTGGGVSGLAVLKYLVGIGATVLVTADRVAPTLPADLRDAVRSVADLPAPPAGTTLLVTSPGFRPTTPILVAATAAGVEVIGEIELAWRVDRASVRPRDWLVVTGTNGKTTTVGMLESILRADGQVATACGNVGWPALEAVMADPRQETIAAELSSFQLHYAPSVRPAVGLLLNLVEDHLDWYGGSMQAYGADKARALTGAVAIAVVDDPGAAALLSASPAPRKVEVTAGPPPVGGLGVLDGYLFDDAYGAGPLLPAAEIRPAGVHNVTNALSAAAMALASGVSGTAVAQGLRDFLPGAHRNVQIAEVDGVAYVDDSKATNPHAAAASLASYARVVWIAGGQLKGASIDDLVLAIADRLVGVVLIGVDAPIIAAALSRHAPNVPRMDVTGNDDGVMTEVVGAAATMAAPGDVVLLAPAAASLDMFASYAARGAAFAAAVAWLETRS